MQNYRWTTTFPEFQYYEVSTGGSGGTKQFNADIVEGVRVEKSVYEPSSAAGSGKVIDSG